MHKTARELLFKERHISRRGYVSIVAVLTIVAACAAILGWAGRYLPPPQFKISKDIHLEPVRYSLWREASDWLAGRRYVLLTFDDGPYGHGVDEKILNILTKHQANAIFFVVCDRITNSTINVPNEVLSRGNLIGNHSYSHLHLLRLHGDALTGQVDDCSDRIEEVTGVRPEFFRPPWGQTSPEVLQVIQTGGMQQVLWNANSGDTRLEKPKEIIHTSLHEVAIGNSTSILLMHSHPTTADALDKLLTELERLGTRFVLPNSSESGV